MGFSFGGKSSRQGQGNQGVNAGFQLLSAISPQYATTGSFHNDTQEFLANQEQPIGSILQGIPGVITYDQFGNAQPIGSNNLPTTMPGLSEIGRFDTVFEKFDNGNLSPSSAGLLDTFLNTAQTPSALGMEGAFADMLGAIGGGGAGGGGGISGGRLSAEAPPDIGTLTAGIIQNLPPEMQKFINDTLNASSPERVGDIMQEFEDSISARSAQNAHLIGGDLLSAFAAEGTASAGSTAKNLQALALQATVEANAQIAAGKLEILNQQIQAMQVGVQLSNSLLSAGATEQGNLAALEAAELSANAAIIQAEINASARLQETLLAAQTSLAQSIIGAQTSLELGRMDLLGAGFQGILNQSTLEEQARIDSLMMPYNLLLGHRSAGQTTRSGGGSGIDLNGLLAGAGSVIGSVLAPGIGTAAGAAIGGGGGLITGGASDIRFKEDITRIGTTNGGFPVYTFRYKGYPQFYMGVMAQDVEKVRPDLVSYDENGYRYVDYKGIN